MPYICHYIQGVFFRGLQLWEQIENDIFNIRGKYFWVIWKLYVANTKNKNRYEVLHKKYLKLNSQNILHQHKSGYFSQKYPNFA